MRKLLRITQGDDRWLEIPLLRDGRVQPYGSGAVVTITVKAGDAAPEAEAPITLSTTAGGILIPDPAGNVALGHFTPAVTAGLTPGRYACHVRVALTEEETQTVDKFDLHIEPNLGPGT